MSSAVGVASTANVSPGLSGGLLKPSQGPPHTHPSQSISRLPAPCCPSTRVRVGRASIMSPTTPFP